MSAKTIRNALGVLQENPDDDKAWSELERSLTDATDMAEGELPELLEAARRAHEGRREYDAVARLLAIEVKLAEGTEAEAALVAEQARVLDDELLDDEAAVAAFKRLLELRPGDTSAEEAIEKAQGKRGKWLELTKRYIEESKSAGEPSFKSSLLVSASEVAYRYGRPAFSAAGEKNSKKKLDALNKQIVEGLSRALEVDPKNRRAALLLERVHRGLGNAEAAAKVIEHLASETNAKDEKIAAYIRLARLSKRELGDNARAMRAYEQVLDLSPGQPEATSALVEHFSEQEDWDHLVSLYEGQLAGTSRNTAHDAGTLLQLAMIHWKMRKRPEAAEPFFERLRKLEPAHAGTVSFFREYLGERGDTARLTSVLTDAHRAMPDGEAKAALVGELAKLNEQGENSTKAIEQWRALLRQDPKNTNARDALKRLYRQTAGWTSLADLLRAELEKIPADDKEARLPVLREIAQIYSEQVKSDSALVTVLSQIIALDPNDATAVRELVRVYASLGRWRDLLTTQSRLAEIESDPAAKAVLYREVARRWLEQFSNVQNAVEAYEKLYEVVPDDQEANEKLRELYTKRRAYKPLYELLEGIASRTEDPEARRAIWMEMAKLAAERLDRGSSASGLYKLLLKEDPTQTVALDALEKQAERDKDFATVAEVLERRVELAPDAASKLVILQKLGALYSDRLKDHGNAMKAWKRVLELSPGHAKGLRVLRDTYLAAGDYDGLTELYAGSNDWEGLAEVLSSAGDKATDPNTKIELSYRAADVYADKLSAPERAFRAYERVLSARPDDKRAAAALVPLYEEDEKWTRLPALYEVLVGHAADDEERLALYGKLAEVTGLHLSDRVASFSYARKAYELAPDAPGALEAFEKATRASGEWTAFAQVLESRLDAKKGKKEKEARRVLKAKIAETYAVELGRVDEAVATYRALVEEDESDELAVSTLDRILRAADRKEDLRWLFGLRVERANTAQKIQLLNEWASLEEDVFGAPDHAITTYKKLLELVPQHGGALRALARLLRSAGDPEGAAAALEKDRDQREGADRAQREVELARIYMGSLGRHADALAAAKRALDLVQTGSEHRAAIEVVEELLHVPQTRGKAAVLLEKSYAESNNAARQAEVLEVMIATAASKNDRIALYHRLADVHEKSLGNPAVAFDVVARAASEFPMELALWDRLSVLANRTQRSQAFVDAIAAAVPPTGETGLPADVEIDLSERAATLYDEMLGEIQRAQPYLERILGRDPSNERAFGRLKQILTTLERWPELEALYERAVAAASDTSRQADLLAEVALVAEEITDDRPKAIRYYERILQIEPGHEQATRALDSLYAFEERWDSLAKLIAGRLENASADDALALKLRLGTLYFTRINDAPAALRYLEEVLQSDPLNRDARDLVEKCLAVPELRERTAVVLEAVYIAQDATRDLVRVLEVRLETANNVPDRRELLRRIAELRDERLNEGAFDVYARLVPIAPDDAHARTRLLELARKLGAHEEAGRVLSESAKVAEAPQPRAEILSEVAKLYEDHLNDPTRAEAVYREVLAIDPNDVTLALPAARALERIYAASGQAAELAKILRIEVNLEEDAGARRELQGRLGELAEGSLNDPSGAIEAWKARLDDDPVDETALAALDRLYERTSDWRALVDVLRARERHANDAATRKTLMVRIAVTLADKLSDVNEAILAYRALVDEFGPDIEHLSALEMLFEVADRWQDLAETIEMHLGLVESPAERLTLLARLGSVKQTRLDDVPGAIETYRQALAIDASHQPSRTALEALLENADARREAAGILRPLYEIDGAQERLLKVLDIEAEYAESVDAKLAIFAQAVRVSEQDLRDAPRAFAYASRGLREAAGESDLPAWLARVERLAEATNGWAALADLLKTVAADILDGDLQLEVTLRIAALARTRLDDRETARAYYVKALELRSDDTRALEALESLYEQAGDHPALLDILKRRAEAAKTDEDKKRILFKEAELCDRTLEDRPAAIAVYEDILEIGPDRAAFDALERLYTQTDRHDDRIALYERQIALGGPAEQRATLHHRLGTVLEKQLQEVDRAFDQYEEALRLDAQHPATVASLESLMKEPPHAYHASELLEQVYLTRLDWRSVMATIEARLAGSQDPDERRGLLRRLAKLHEEQEENYLNALETIAKLLSEDITDEPTWAELERLARVANAEGRLAEIYAAELEKVTSDEPATARLAKRTGEIFEAQRNVDRALHFYRRAYAFAPEEDETAFRAIDRLLREAGRPQERVTLFRDSLQYREDPAARMQTLHTIATIEETELNDDAAAIATYGAALDLDDSNTHALEALSRLYARSERWQDLADLTRRRAESSALPEDEAKFRFDLGRLLETRLSDKAGAIDEYQAVVDVAAGGEPATNAVRALEALLHEPEHKARVVEILRPIYERNDDWRHLIAVNAERLGIAPDDSEKITILRETAKLWEERGGDTAKAFDAVREAFVLDPDDGDTRGELDRLAESTSRWDDLASAYEAAIERLGDDGDIGKKELLGALARLHDKRRDDPRRALEAWERLFKLDETDVAPLEEMDALATLLSDWPTLVRVLAKKAELTANDEDRASTWRRIGEARRDMLDDATGAIDAYERALELEPDSAFTIDNLIPLFEAKNDAARLVDLYRRRVELCGEDDEGLKFTLLVDAANRYEQALGDRREAIDLLGQALLVKPGTPEAADVTRRLDQLFVAEGMWPDLLDNLRQQISLEQDEAARRLLQKRVGALLAKELEDPRQALDAYREVLAAGFDEDAARAIRELGESRDDLRIEAADALEPVLRASNRQAELVDVLEMRLRAQTDVQERARTLREIANVSEGQLGDAPRAENALLRALAEEPESPALHQEIERVAALLGKAGWSRYADALTERAAAIFDANITSDLYVRLGRVSEEQLQDDARAAKAYVSAAEQSGDNETVLGALDRLFGRLGDPRALANILERRIAIETTPAARADLYHRLASLQIAEFGDKTQGLATLRLAVEESQDHAASRASIEQLLEDPSLFDEAFEALETVYRGLAKNEDLARLFERRVVRAENVRDRARARLDLARILEEQAGDASRAQRTVEAALAEDPSDADVLSELERLAAINDNAGQGGWRAAADALANALGSAADVPAATRGELWSRLAGWRKDKLSDVAGAEQAFSQARTLDPENLEILRALEDLRRAPGRERELIETLRARVALEGDTETKRELLKEAKQLAESTLGDKALAEACLRDLLAVDDADLWALEELTRIREESQDSAEVIRLLLRRAELEADGRVISELRHRAARVMSEHDETDRAIKIYQELFEDDPADTLASSRLRDLYAAQGRPRDLARLLEQLVDGADTPSARAVLRLDLAKLQEELDQGREAVSTLRAILDEDATHAEAVVALSELLEKSGQDEELADLLNSQIDAARDRQDHDAELRLQVRLGEVFEGRLKDTPRALATYEAVLEREPAHRGALEAVARLAESRDDWARAASALGHLLDMATDATGVEAATRLAAARGHLGDDDGVEAALKRAIELDPTNTGVRGELRALYERRKKWSELAELLVSDVELLQREHPEAAIPQAAPEPTSGGSSLRPAGGSLRAGSMPSIVPAPTGALADVVRLLRRAAEIHITERQAPADAIPILERATALVPQDREMLLLLCDAFTASGRDRDAAEVLERVIASFGAKRTKELSLYHHRLGKALASLGDKDVALTQLDMAFKIDPGSVGVLKDLGVLALETNDLDRAQKTFRALLLQRLDPSTGISKGEVFYYLGEISSKQGDKAKAVQMFERAIENEPSLERAKAKLVELKG